MNICVRNLDSNESKWFSILSEQSVFKQEIEDFIAGKDFLIVDQSDSSFKFKEINNLNSLLATAQTLKSISESHVSVDAIQKIADYFGLLLSEALDFHNQNFIEENASTEDFTYKYLLSQHEKAISGLPPIVRENIDWQRIYETISVNDVISFKLKSTMYHYYRR